MGGSGEWIMFQSHGIIDPSMPTPSGAPRPMPPR